MTEELVAAAAAEAESAYGDAEGGDAAYSEEGRSVEQVIGSPAPTRAALLRWRAPRPVPPVASRGPVTAATEHKRDAPPPPSRTDCTRLVPPPVLNGHVSSLLPY